MFEFKGNVKKALELEEDRKIDYPDIYSLVEEDRFEKALRKIVRYGGAIITVYRQELDDFGGFDRYKKELLDELGKGFRVEFENKHNFTNAIISFSLYIRIKRWLLMKFNKKSSNKKHEDIWWEY